MSQTQVIKKPIPLNNYFWEKLLPLVLESKNPMEKTKKNVFQAKTHGTWWKNISTQPKKHETKNNTFQIPKQTNKIQQKTFPISNQTKPPPPPPPPKKK